MQVVLFDLDNTLLAGDSDLAWSQFVIGQGWVDAERHAQERAAFYYQYEAGALDIEAFQRFTLAPLQGRPWSELKAARAEFLDAYIRPIVAPHARALMAHHAHAGHLPAIVTATNRFITEPIAELLDIGSLLATEPEFADGAFTGEIVGTPTYREGKIRRVDAFLAGLNEPVERTYFYSDSHNDLPLLREVDVPVAVDADPTLAAEARHLGWASISLRGEQPPEFIDLRVASSAAAVEGYAAQRLK